MLRSMARARESLSDDPDFRRKVEEDQLRHRAIAAQDFQPADGDAHGSIQWKGTNVCMDLYCPCGFQGHIDADFFYYYRCHGCQQVYKVGSTVKLIKLTPDQVEAEDIDASAIYTDTDPMNHNGVE